MAVSVKIPKLGVEMTSAKLAEWRAENGAQVEIGQTIAVIETDKLTNELEAPESGYLVHVGEVGEEYDIGVEVARISESVPAPGGEKPASAVSAGPAPAEEPVSAAAAAAPAVPGGWVRATPLARAVANVKGIDLHGVTGTGYGGSITKRDVEAFVQAVPAPAATAKPMAAAAPAAAERPAAAEISGKSLREERTFSPARASVARHMMQSLSTTAQMTDIRQMEVSELKAFREHLAERADLMGFKVSYLDLILKMVTLILKKLPEFNASVGDQSLLIWDSVNLGIAVANDQGLVVPVLHSAEKMSLAEIHANSQELIARARAHTLRPEDISGGTFTISNYGSFGSECGTPVLNLPQVAILGVGAMTQAPVVKDGAVVAGHVMCTSLTLDHRVLDGESAAAFQNLVKHYVTYPELILID